jgi:type IV pilus assembly protein PilE
MPPTKVLPRKMTGFTLIELMIVVAIIGILASIGYPNYKGYVVKANRAEAKVALEGLSGAMERYYSESNSYVGATITGTPTTVAFSSKVPKDGTASNYTLSISDLTASTYTLTATVTSGSTQDGDGKLILTHTGERKWGTQSSWAD